MVFVDTSVWFAFFLPTDPDHQRVRKWVGTTREPVLTTDYCIDETLTLLLAPREPTRALETGRELFERGIARSHFVTPNEIHRAWFCFQQRAAAGWSFTDCTSLVVITDLGIRTAATLDAHFRQFVSPSCHSRSRASRAARGSLRPGLRSRTGPCRRTRA